MSDRARLSQQTEAAGESKQKRVNRGYAIREDLIKELKFIAVREDKNLYQVMEEAFEQYLDRHSAQQKAAGRQSDRSEP